MYPLLILNNAHPMLLNPSFCHPTLMSFHTALDSPHSFGFELKLCFSRWSAYNVVEMVGYIIVASNYERAR